MHYVCVSRHAHPTQQVVCSFVPSVPLQSGPTPVESGVVISVHGTPVSCPVDVFIFDINNSQNENTVHDISLSQAFMS